MTYTVIGNIQLGNVLLLNALTAFGLLSRPTHALANSMLTPRLRSNLLSAALVQSRNACIFVCFLSFVFLSTVLYIGFSVATMFIGEIKREREERVNAFNSKTLPNVHYHLQYISLNSILSH